MKIVLAQLNFLVGDLVGNTDKMIEAIKDAGDAELIVFSELSITGYPPLDLINAPDFLYRQQLQIDRLLAASRNTESHILFGCVTLNNYAALMIGGKPLSNSALLIHNGVIAGQHDKILLPTYDIFDEERYFEAGEMLKPLVFQIEGKKFGVLICEDCWNDATDKPIYNFKPVEHLVQLVRPDYIVTLNASPGGIGKQQYRYDMFSAMAKEYGVGFIYVNQIGANDDVVFDGASFVMNKTGKIAAQIPAFYEAVHTFDTEDLDEWIPYSTPKIEFIYQSLVMGIRDYVKKCGFKKVVVGSSGGIDSAVVLALAVQALGADNVKAITMPSAYSSEGSYMDSRVLCNKLGVELFQVPIGEIFDKTKYWIRVGAALENDEPGTKGLEWENTQARIRGMILMGFSNRHGALVLSTGNKSEMSVGYCTLYGDMCGGLGVLSDVYKTEVFALAEYINFRARKELIPNVIIHKAPSAELAPEQKDTDSLPPYPVLDRLLRQYVEGIESLSSDPENIAGLKEVTAYALTKNLTANELYKQTVRKVDSAEFKRKQAAPGIRVRAQAFGAGRRLPVARKF